MSFCDDFERTALGSDWLIPTALPSGNSGFYQTADIDDPVPFTIVTGAAVGATDPTEGTGFSYTSAVGYWHEAFPGDCQFIDIDFALPGDYPASSAHAVSVIYGYLMLDPATFTGYGFEILSNGDGFRQRWYHWTNGTADFDSYDYFHDFAGGEPRAQMRFELYADPTPGLGRLKAFLGGTLVNSWPRDPGDEGDWTLQAVGDYIGMSSRINHTVGLPPNRDNPRIENICGGSCAEPVGEGVTVTVVADPWTTGADALRRVTPALVPVDDGWIELAVTNWQHTMTPYEPAISMYLWFEHVGATTPNSIVFQAIQGPGWMRPPIGGGTAVEVPYPSLTWSIGNPATSTVVAQGQVMMSFAGNPTVTIRGETDADGSVRAYVNGSLAGSGTIGAHPVTRVGFGIDWTDPASTGLDMSPRVLSAAGAGGDPDLPAGAGGVPSPWSDDFARADGPLADANWTGGGGWPGPDSGYQDYSIVSGAVVSTRAFNVPEGERVMRYMVVPATVPGAGLTITVLGDPWTTS